MSDSTENVVVLTDSQTHIRDAVKSWSNSGAILVLLVRDVLTNYYGKDSQSCDNLQFLINELHSLGHKRYVAALLRIMPLYVFCDVSFSKAGDSYNVANTKGTPKPRKAKGLAALEAFKWGDLTALLQHPSLIVAKKGGKKDKKEAVSFRDVVMAELEKGTTLDQLIEMLAEIASEVDAKVA